MIDEAKRLEPETTVKRTKASAIDTLTGHIGEFVFAQYYYGDWRRNSVGDNKGKVDFGDIEVKASAYPYRKGLNLLVREDYAARRKPKYYVQIVIDVPSAHAKEIKAGMDAILCGFATSEDVDNAPKRDFGAKKGYSSGYSCHYIPIKDLTPIDQLG